MDLAAFLNYEQIITHICPRLVEKYFHIECVYFYGINIEVNKLPLYIRTTVL